MDIHKLLQNKIDRHLTIDCIENPSFKEFIQSVNDSYLDYERENKILKNAFEANENEYKKINDRLKAEVEQKKLAANNLYKCINNDDVDYDINYDHNDDLLFVSEFLQAQISKIKDADAALLENRKELEDYKFAIDQSAIIAITDEKGVIKTVNDNFCEISQFSREELIGNTHAITNSKFHSKIFMEDMEKTISGGNIWKGLIRNEKKNGDIYWVDTTIVPFLDANKKPFQFLAVRFDVTEIKNAEIEIRKANRLTKESEEHNRLIMDSSLNSIVTINSVNIITFWNQQAESVFGWKKEEVLGKNMIDLLIPSRYRDIWNNVIDQYHKNGKNPYINQLLELTLLHKAGNEFYGETSITPIIQDGMSYFSAFIQDVTKRKEVENQLHQNTELLKTIMANLRSGIRMEDQNRKLLFANKLYCDMRNIKSQPEELAGMDGSNLPNEAPLFFKDSERLIAKTKKTLHDRKLVQGELLETLDDHFIERDYIPLLFDNEYKGHLWKYTDVTEKVQTLRLLRQSEEHNRLIMDSSLNSIVSTDKDKKITFWNQQAEIVFGWKKEEVLGKSMIDLLIPLRYRSMWNNVIDQYPIDGEKSYFDKRLELSLLHKSGNEFYAETSITPVIVGEATYFCAFIQDISKRRKAENKLSETAELLKAFLFNIQSGICVVDDNNKILFINQHLCDMREVKFTPEELTGQDGVVLLHESKLVFKDQESYTKRVLEIENDKQIVLGELLETTDNRFIERDYIPLFIDNQNRAHLWKSTDVTQRIRSQKLLEQSEQLNSLIMSSSINAIVIVDSEGKITFWNRRAEKVFGYTNEEIIGLQLSEIILPHQNANIYDPTVRNAVSNDITSALNKNIELKGINKNGEEIIMDCSIVPINQNKRKFHCLFIQDISEKKEAENLRKIQEEKYQNVIANMNLGLLEVDNNEIIQYANPSFVSMSGFEETELIGKKTSEIFNYEDNVDVVKSKSELRKEGTSDIYQIPIKNKNGDLKWWAISGAPNYDSTGNFIGTIGIHLDITAQKQLEVDLEKEKTNALESSKAKEIFLANMSHEIRTPLNAIIGFLRELQKGELSEIQRKYVDSSTIASKHLLAIINNILDISKIEAGEMSLSEEDFVFEKSISNVTAVLNPMLKQKGLDLNVSISNKIEKILKGDTLRLQQILFNLIGNSIKFTSKGSVSINCEVVEDDTLFQKLHFSITDTGIGMDKSFIKNIYNKFSQEDLAITRKYGGTGLGLSITKDLIKLMGGIIEIESEKSVGTTMHIYLKYPKGTNQQFDDLDNDKPLSKIDNISILLVEDNYLNRIVAQNSLQYYNCKVTEAENGLEAIEILKNRNFDIILMDIQMPDMGGIEATEIIRKELKLSTPIIALTANAFKTEIDKFKNAGMDDYVSKPFDEDILIETIAKYTTNKKVSIPQTVFIETSSAGKLYNLSSLQSLSRGDDDFVVKMVSIFVEQTTDVIEKIAAAILQDDFTQVSRLIHKIKPSVESLGIMSIIEEIRLLEKTAVIEKDKEQISALFVTIKDVLEKAVIQLIADEING